MIFHDPSQQIIITVPSKTFLLGEYLALAGGPSLILNTQPRFECNVIAKKNLKNQGIETSSPAGKYLTLNSGFFANYSLDFKDPHQGKGGLGCSSAQFAMLSIFKEVVIKKNACFPCDHSSIKKLINIPFLLTAYRQVAWDGNGIPPSGADVIGQLFGGITYFDLANNSVEVYKWPFTDIDCFIIKTDTKLPTHEHLRTLKSFSSKCLSNILNNAKHAFETTDATKFIDCVNDYYNELEKLNFVAKQTQALLSTLRNYDECLAAKGCGALGADVILVITEKNNINWLTEWLQTHNLTLISSSNELSDGVKFHEMV